VKVWSCLSPGIEQTVTSLSLYARYQLAELLDHKDWTALGKALGLQTPDLDPDELKSPSSIYSTTDGLLNDWVQNKGQSPPLTTAACTALLVV